MHKVFNCKKCNAENTEDNLICQNCGAYLDLTSTESIQFDLKNKQTIAERYEIVQEIGRGSMGIVYKVFDKKLERFVALKSLIFREDKPVKIDDRRKRMITEAKAAAKLEHQNILVIHDVIHTGNIFIHIAMELIDGISLEDIIVPGGLSDYDQVIDIILQICDAIGHAHDRGIIHRDLKPSNILLKNKKVVKITDFGLARITYDPKSMEQDKGLILGTLPYMPPERFGGLNNDTRSDIYAVGIILYELLTGKRPFRGHNRAELIFRIQNAEYKLLEKLRENIPPFFQEIVSKALASEPASRFQTAIEMKSELLGKYKEYLKRTREAQKDTIWNVPIYRNVNFTGRNSILKKLREDFTSDESASKLIALHGLGGMGKTQIALEYCLRNAKDHPIVWWIRSEEKSNLVSEYASLAEKLDLPVKFLKETEVVDSVKRWLGSNFGWLLVFDNAEKVDDIRYFIPESNSGHILITSRNPNWGCIAKTIVIHKWETEEAVKFLIKRTKDNDRNSALELADRLGNLPLALEQAGAYIEGSGRSITDYLVLYGKHNDKLLKRGKPVNYPDTVATTWEMSFRKLRKESEAGVELLNLLSFLAPDDIPLNIIRYAGEHIPDAIAEVASDPIDLDDAVRAIRSYSLIDRTGDSLSIHRLVQEMARDRMDDESKKMWTEIAVKVVNHSFNFDEDDVDTWQECSKLLPHVHASTENTYIHSKITQISGELLYQTGCFLRARGNFKDALSSLKKALFIKKKVHGENDPEVTKVLRKIGLTLYDLGELNDAKIFVEIALAIDEVILGTEHPDVAKNANTLGIINWANNDLELAQDYLNRALEINKVNYGSDNLEIAKNYNNLGLIMENQHEYKEALLYFNRALSVLESIYGSMHYKVLGVLNNLANIYRQLGNYNEAMIIINKSIKIEKAAFGLYHPSVADTIIKHGLISQDLGNVEEALNLFSEALSINKRIFGSDHPLYAINLTYIGDLKFDLCVYKDALEHYERALLIMNSKYKADHPNVVTLSKKLETVIRKQKELSN